MHSILSAFSGLPLASASYEAQYLNRLSTPGKVPSSPTEGSIPDAFGFFLRSMISHRGKRESMSKQRSPLSICRELTRCGSADQIREIKMQGVYRGEMG